MVSKCVKIAASKLFKESLLNSVIVRTSRVSKEPDKTVTHVRYNYCKHR